MHIQRSGLWIQLIILNRYNAQQGYPGFLMHIQRSGLWIQLIILNRYNAQQGYKYMKNVLPKGRKERGD